MTHLKAQALLGCLLGVSQGWAWAGVSSPGVPSWTRGVEEGTHPILPLQARHPLFLVSFFRPDEHWALEASETQYKDDEQVGERH